MDFKATFNQCCFFLFQFVFSSSSRVKFSLNEMSYTKAGSYHHVPRDFNVLIQTCSANIQKITQNSKKTAFPTASSLVMKLSWDILDALYCDAFILLNIAGWQYGFFSLILYSLCMY